VNRISAVILTAAAMVFAIGCSGGGNNLNLKEGDKWVATETLDRISFEASYGDNAKSPDHTEGGFTEIPEGTVLEVYVRPRAGLKSVEVKPVKTSTGVTDTDQLTEIFVPERYRKPPEKPSDTFMFYTISLPIEFFGTKVKKVE